MVIEEGVTLIKHLGMRMGQSGSEADPRAAWPRVAYHFCFEAERQCHLAGLPKNDHSQDNYQYDEIGNLIKDASVGLQETIELYEGMYYDKESGKYEGANSQGKYQGTISKDGGQTMYFKIQSN